MTRDIFPAKHDRIVEVGIVHVSPDGEVQGRFETLVNPQRDMGPQHIHGISAAAVADAPVFRDIAGDVAELLDDRVLVAHNAVFDARFLSHQMGEAGFVVPEADRWLCTMRLGEHVAGVRKLAECCRVMGVTLEDAHSAGADAFATAELLRAFRRVVTDQAWWDAWLAVAVRQGVLGSHAVRWVPRAEAFKPRESFLERLSVRVPAGGDDALSVDYLGLLDRVLLDRVISISEASALVDLASELGLSPEGVTATHRAYFDGLVAAAWADGVLTEAEKADIRTVGAVLGVDGDVVDAALEQPTRAADAAASAFRLRAGDRIVLTGEMSRPRDAWESILVSLGYTVGDSVTKATRLLVAADPDSMSGKAKKARDYGIPIVTEAGLERLLEAAAPPA